MKFYVFLAASLLFALSYPRASQAQLYECNGMWTNKPCVGKETKTLEEKENIPREKPAVRAETQPTPLETPSEEAEPTPEISIRPLIKTRPEVKLHYTREKETKFRWRFWGDVSGHGSVKLAIYFIVHTHGGDLSKKRLVRSQILKLPNEGGTETFDWGVRIPGPHTSWESRLEAKYTSKRWKGYHDLSGCCSTHGGVALRCLSNGNVLCKDKELSPTCKCE